MLSSRVDIFDDGAEARSSRFHAGAGVEEVHLSIIPGPAGALIPELDSLERAYDATLAMLGLQRSTAVFRRAFVSDLANQERDLRAHPVLRTTGPSALSLVEQPPLPARRVALWAYHLAREGRPVPVEAHGSTVAAGSGPVRHLWTTELTARGERLRSSSEQTRDIFEAYDEELCRWSAALERDALRTWLFVRDIDNNYDGLVRARKEIFESKGMIADTRFIASTGIEGRVARPDRLVMMDAYAVTGLAEGQVVHIDAPDHLCRTSAYGVTFERASMVLYGDRRQVLVSGTASIDARGRTMHEGDVGRQLDRVFENVEALLAHADATLDDLAQLLVYLRDPADLSRVRAGVESRLPATPQIYVHGPICRPSWLVEIEGIALVDVGDPRFEPFFPRR